MFSRLCPQLSAPLTPNAFCLSFPVRWLQQTAPQSLSPAGVPDHQALGLLSPEEWPLAPGARYMNDNQTKLNFPFSITQARLTWLPSWTAQLGGYIHGRKVLLDRAGLDPGVRCLQARSSHSALRCSSPLLVHCLLPRPPPALLLLLHVRLFTQGPQAGTWETPRPLLLLHHHQAS